MDLSGVTGLNLTSLVSPPAVNDVQTEPTRTGKLPCDGVTAAKMFPRFYARLVLLICIFDSSECSAAASAAPNFGRNLQQEVPDTSHEQGADGAGGKSLISVLLALIMVKVWCRHVISSGS